LYINFLIFIEYELKACKDLYPKFSVNPVAGTNHDRYCIGGHFIYSINSNGAVRSQISYTQIVPDIHLVDIHSNTGVVVDDPTSLNDHPEYYVLIDCNDSECKQTQGYYKSTDIYKFVGITTGRKEEPSVGGIVDNNIDDDGKCVDNNIGKVFGSKASICSDNGIKIDFSDDDKNYHILNGAASGTPFGDEGLVVLKVTASAIVKDKFNPPPGLEMEHYFF